MMVKAVALFLAAMALLAMFGRLRLRRGRRSGTAGGTAALRCAGCGAPLVGRGPCPCGREPGRRGG